MAGCPEGEPSSMKERLLSSAPDRFFVRLGCAP